MELFQLKYFMAVAQYQHMTKAAESLHIAQPAVSQAIRHLEEELQVTLFDRENRHISLNDCGRLLQKRLAPVLSALDAIPEELKETYRGFFTERKDDEAVKHLFDLACGLDSRILGEDQIITQVKDALAMSRAAYAADNVLEILFRMAVTAAKKVKTEVILTDANQSVIHQALAVLGKEGFSAKGKKCMVIGNGAMGKLAATVLKEAGADVTVTVRQYRSGIVDVPPAAGRIDYSKRYEKMPECRYIFSATASPNTTITLEKLPVEQLQQDIKKQEHMLVEKLYNL